uniref:Uncharacterized protein n=1 Tax=Oryza meridionalis TaxID=40149 RepID=A0A0E0F2R4_9ORYZ
MAMAGCYCVHEHQLEDDDAVGHRLLPPEILVEIGIVAAADHAAAVHARRDAVVEELAARLVGILGLTSPSSSATAGGIGEKKRAAAATTTPTTSSGGATPPYRSHVRRGEQHLAGGGGVIDGGMARYHAPGFGTTQWLAPPAWCGGGGTGVFLPRGEVYPTRTSNPPRKQVRNRRVC